MSKKTLTEKVEDWNKMMEQRRIECEQEGHKDVYWLKHTISNRSKNSDKVHGQCRYCLSHTERPLSESERKEVSKFYKTLNYDRI